MKPIQILQLFFFNISVQQLMQIQYAQVSNELVRLALDSANYSEQKAKRFLDSVIVDKKVVEVKTENSIPNNVEPTAIKVDENIKKDVEEQQEIVHKDESQDAVCKDETDKVESMKSNKSSKANTSGGDKRNKNNINGGDSITG